MFCYTKDVMDRNQTTFHSRFVTRRDLIFPSFTNDSVLKHLIRGHRTVSSILFPHHCYKIGRLGRELFPSPRLNAVSSERRVFSFWSKVSSNFSLFPKVYASESQKDDSNSTGADSETKTNNIINTAGVSEDDAQSLSTIEALAKAYIAKESGMERVRMAFSFNHKGDPSPQLLYLQVGVISICLICFIINYVPAYKFAKSEFIREHNATAFKTNIEAARKMSDYASLKGIIEGARFATKIAAFSASFLVISQVISSYRNKTSMSDSTIAAAITGGLARIQMGPKGFISGSVVGMALGTLYGAVASLVLHQIGLTEDVIHLQTIMSRLEVERSIEGDSNFKQRTKELTEQTSSVSA